MSSSDLTKARMPDGRRTNGTVKIPEEIQEPMRNRLRMMRESRGKNRTDLQTISSGTMTKSELNDISTMRLGDLYGLAVEFDVSVHEFLEFLIGKVDTEVTPEARRIQRMIVYLRGLADGEQELACNLVQSLVEHSLDTRSVDRIERMPGVRRDGRVSVREALEE